ncbi:hypothetical protein J6590_105377 [Homalodisca vitripennis]|nr:hypothetical protein J6590_105377 [Homalodisca vitripennis]
MRTSLPRRAPGSSCVLLHIQLKQCELLIGLIYKTNEPCNCRLTRLESETMCSYLICVRPRDAAAFFVSVCAIFSETSCSDL